MPNLTDVLSEKNTTLQTPELKQSMGGGATPNGELMREAREALEGNWAMAVVGNVLYYLLVMSVSFFVVALVMFAVGLSSASGTDPAMLANIVSGGGQLIQGLLQGAFIVGFCSFFLVIAQGGAADLTDLFTGFRRFWKAFAAYFLMGLFVFLWYLLFIIPGIIAVFRYSMVFFIIADDPNVGPLEAIRQSKQMMKGNKWKFFCLGWRFFGWLLLCPLTCGIGYLWLIPYMQTTFARFYEDVK